MLPAGKDTTCYTCGKKVEFIPCSSREAPSEDAPCRVLEGWLTVHRWKGMRSIEPYSFCSFTCLQRWVEAQAPKVPRTFLKAFSDE